jgi:hypothetical protein
MSDFVKSATTTTPIAKSQADIIAMLGRYGATGFGFRRVGPIVSVTFHLPRAGGGEDYTVEIPVNVASVAKKLGDTSRIITKQSRANRPASAEEHAERVAWRVLHLWIDAALSAVQLGAQTIEEAFFAHLLVATDDGRTGRLVDYVKSIGAGSGGVLPSATRLLGSGK